MQEPITVSLFFFCCILCIALMPYAVDLIWKCKKIKKMIDDYNNPE